ncbi:MAG TPA: phosphatidate cytidylyltransferase, partial [Planctomycetota bacterium]|nr:phosphatidate cytidylyltransferase [Planctomycetota bacterium]
LVMASTIALLALIEASLMGTLFLRALPVILILPLVGVTMLEFAFIQRPPTGRPWPQLGLELMVAAAIAMLVHALTRGMSQRTRPRQVTILAATAAIVGTFGWLDARGLSPFGVLPWFFAFAAVAFLVAALVNRTPERRADLAISLGLALWIAVPLPAFAQIARMWGIPGIVSVIVLSKIGDVAGYYVGSAIGRSHPFPNLSPGKTTAGCVASLIAGIVAGAALSALGILPAGSLGIAGGALIGLFTNLASQAGDLFESWVKRRARVKDSSTWLGPSGGVLDVVDSLLFSIPTALLVWPLVLEA